MMLRLLFRQAAANEWAVLFDVNGCDIVGNEVLEMELSIKDPQFPLYTEWEGFNPRRTYGIRLPAATGDIDIATATKQRECTTDDSSRPDAGFCKLALSLSQEMAEAAKNGHPQASVLHFKAPVRQWVYVFRKRRGSIIPNGELLLVNMDNGKSYSLSDNDEYGNGEKFAIIPNGEPMRKDMTCHLHLVLLDNGRKRTLQTHIAPPAIGQYVSKRKDELMQVCYY